MLVEARAVPLVLYLPCLVYLDVRLVRDHPSCRPLHERPDEGTGNQLYSAMSSGVCFLAGTPRTKWGGGRELYKFRVRVFARVCRDICKNVRDFLAWEREKQA